jgi:hypothetical protein
VYLHVGAPKTGTTYLQDLLWRHSGRLRAAGVLYPGLSSDAQFHAVQDLLDDPFQGHPDPAVPGAWGRVRDQVRAWPGTSVLSHEWFSRLDAVAVGRAVDDLAGVELHVVCTARDLGRQVPAAWQEDIKNRQTLTFAEFTRELRADPGTGHPLATLFWQLQDLPRLLEPWARRLPADRVHLVTLPARGGGEPDELWRRFAEATGLAGLDLDTSAADGNRSMGAAEAHLVRRLNLALGDRVGWPAYDVWVKHELARVLADRAGCRPPALPAEDHDWVAERSARMLAPLRAAGYHVVGDLEELVPAPPREGTRHPDEVGAPELLDAAVDALAGLVGALSGWDTRARRGWRRALADLSEKHAAVGSLRRRYLSVKARRARLHP